MPGFFIYNGEFFENGETVIGPANRSLRYGDGLFETMRYQAGKIPLAALHFQRLFSGLHTLSFEIPVLFTPTFLEQKILALSKKNKIPDAARIRLSVFRGNGGLFDPENHLPNFIIECAELLPHYKAYNENGLVTDLFTQDSKTMGAFSNLKSNNFLLYAMAAIYAKQKKLNDAFVQNTAGRIADSCIANIFWIKDSVVHTPPTSEGCVDGVMRRYLLDRLNANGLNVEEKPLEIENLLNAEEVFLTNAVSGIRWVKQFQTATYSNSVSAQLYIKFIQPLFT